ncbi:Uncharacterised protein [Candidatus Ornithobacterium hominis]|uniref:hypothetical protein n=1 Tax=Candidatus Ornithobacterium hominis TaxID=2497989 RepID=UPI000E5A2240|nr:hypothetical protein [Candidatus Ornithobacterium hominis]SZD72039.1 Uncharacterised protein [Candidatus Ornithobacterium hominis]
MKNLILLIFLVISGFCFSQIKVTDITTNCEKIGNFGSFVKLEKCDDGNAVFTYQDTKYDKITNYKSFSFEDADNSVDELYNVFLEGLNGNEDKEIKIELPNDTIIIKFEKVFNKKMIAYTFHSVNNTGVVGEVIFLDKKRLNKIFNK